MCSILGWISVLGWQTGLASLAFLVGTMIQGLITLNNPDYVPQGWHGTLLVIAVTAFCIIFNTVLAQRLPMVEGLVLMVHILGFFAVLIPLWVLAPRASASDVFTTFLNLGGWSSTGLAFFVGLLSPVYTLIGADSAVHMSEEINDASLVLPKAIMWAAVVNGSLGWVMIITFAFTLGDLFAILETPTGYPFIQVFYNTTKSNAGTSIMTAIIIVNITSACISTVATASRQTWSFARDQGLPFSKVLSHVRCPLVYPQPDDTCLYSVLMRAFRSKTGKTRMEHPSQCHHPHLCHHNPPLPHQHRIHRCLQRHRLAGPQRSLGHVHHLLHMSGTKKTSGSSATKTMVAGRRWHLRQHRRHLLPACCLGVHFLSRRDTRGAIDYELECCHVLWDHDLCCGLLLCLR